MKNETTTKALIYLLILLLQSCISNDCEDYACFSPPNPFIFELVDKSTGENLFTNGTYNSNEIEIFNTSDSSKIEYSFIDENNINIIQIGSIGWESEIVECWLQINNSVILVLFVDAKRLSENCCSFTRYDEIRIENAVYEYNNQSGIYKILIEIKSTDCIIGELDSITSADQIIGEWKLIREKNPWYSSSSSSSYDYTNDTIIYSFQPNNMLVVTGNRYNNRAFSNGEYNYVFEKENFGNYQSSTEYNIWHVKIKGTIWTHRSQNKLMEIGQSYVDGTDYCFEKIN